MNAGKGDRYRKVDRDKWTKGYDLAFSRKRNLPPNVYYDQRQRRYKVQFGIDGKDVTIGSFARKRDAIRVAREWKRKHGERKRGKPPKCRECE